MSQSQINSCAILCIVKVNQILKTDLKVPQMHPELGNDDFQ